jgi:hypothetical protein
MEGRNTDQTQLTYEQCRCPVFEHAFLSAMDSREADRMPKTNLPVHPEEEEDDEPAEAERFGNADFNALVQRLAIGPAVPGGYLPAVAGPTSVNYNVHHHYSPYASGGENGRVLDGINSLLPSRAVRMLTAAEEPEPGSVEEVED